MGGHMGCPTYCVSTKDRSIAESLPFGSSIRDHRECCETAGSLLVREQVDRVQARGVWRRKLSRLSEKLLRWKSTSGLPSCQQSSQQADGAGFRCPGEAFNSCASTVTDRSS